MIWAFAFALIFVVFAWRDIYDMASGFLDYVMDTLFFCLLTALIFAVGIGFGFIVGTAFPKDWIPSPQARLVSLRNADGVNGTFFLGTGSIGTDQYYFYYKEVEGGYQPGKVLVANNVTVHEENRQDALMQRYVWQFTSSTYEWFGFTWPHEKYDFYIPQGTLKKNFVLQ